MVRRCLAAGLVLVCCSFLLGETARVSTQKGAPAKLAALLVSERDLGGTGLRRVAQDTTPLVDGTLQTYRIFAKDTTGGTAVALDLLFAAPDGAAPPASITNQIAGGDLLKAAANGIGAQAGVFALGGSQGYGEIDQPVEFHALLKGTNHHFHGVSFLLNNVVAVVLYGAPAGQADTAIFDANTSVQEAKLS